MAWDTTIEGVGREVGVVALLMEAKTVLRCSV